MARGCGDQSHSLLRVPEKEKTEELVERRERKKNEKKKLLNYVHTFTEQYLLPALLSPDSSLMFAGTVQ